VVQPESSHRNHGDIPCIRSRCIAGTRTGISTASLTEAEPGAVLVELFPSEGCSSCPPADALLRQIAGKQRESGQLIVGISEHRFDASDRDGTLTTLGDIDGLPSTVGFNGIAAL
jgi:Protein of unknown function (DUF1223)